MSGELYYLILGLLLSIPVGILVNLLTPRVRSRLGSVADWWAQRSRQTAERKIGKLSNQLKQLKSTYADHNKRLMLLVSQSGQMIFHGIMTLIMGFFTFTLVYPYPSVADLYNNERWFESFMATSALLTSAVSFYLLMATYRRFDDLANIEIAIRILEWRMDNLQKKARATD